MLDLFSGIGGFSLAAKWVWGDDLDIVGFCEIEPYAQKVLKKNFPGVPIHEDIKKLRGDEFNEIDLITGGFPCQDISQAGKGAGIKEGTRSGLWFELLRVIGDIRPRFALIENVPMLTVRGGTGVIEDLTEIGYDAEWQIIGADDVGARHRRKRIWIVSYPKHIRRYGVQESEGSGSRIHSQAGQSRAEQSKGSDSGKGRNEDLAHAKGKQSGEQTKSKRRKSISRRSGNSRGDQGKGEKETRKVPHPHRVGEKRDQSQDRQGIGTEQTRQDVPDSLGKRGCSGDTAGKDAEDARQLRGSPPYGYWDTEPDVGRVANGIPSRVDRLKGLGNAIVPQCAIVIMELIKQADAKPQ